MELNLPATSYIVLGLLSDKPMSGYQIRKRGQALQHFYWSPAQSQIYRELRRLEADALVTSWHVEQTGKPNKQLFQVTEKGTAVFQQWLAHGKLPPTMMKHPMLLKLYFSHQTNSDTLIHLLTQFIQTTQENLSQLAIVQEYLELEPDAGYNGMVIEWSIHHHESELTMAKKLLNRLQTETAVS